MTRCPHPVSSPDASFGCLFRPRLFHSSRQNAGVFHLFFSSDPHPGNLIRTPEGKLAILDFGLMTQITDNQKFGMIEAISHLVHRDYEGIGDDFKRLDFIPDEVFFFFVFITIKISVDSIWVCKEQESVFAGLVFFCG